jgi:hypothetical protein
VPPVIFVVAVKVSAMPEHKVVVPLMLIVGVVLGVTVIVIVLLVSVLTVKHPVDGIFNTHFIASPLTGV